MMTSLLWKEYREHRSVWVAMAVLAVVSLLVAAEWLMPQGWKAAGEDAGGALAGGGLILTAMYGLVCGAMMFAGERESRGMGYLDALPLSRAELWWSKCLIGILFILLYSAVVVGVGLFVGVLGPHGLAPGWAIVVPLVALETFALGLCASTFCRTVLSAVAFAALLPLPVMWLLSGMCLAMSTDPGGKMTTLPLTLIFHGLATLGALGLSLGTFVERDFEARFVLKPRASSYGTVAPKRQPRRATVLLWLVLRQGAVLVAVLCVLGFLLGLALPATGAGLWPVATLSLGVACGTAVFMGEQAEGAFKFWGDQRLPVGWLWLRRSGFWAGVAAGVCALMLLAALIHAAAQGDVSDDPEMLFEKLLGVSANNRGVGSPLAFLVLWPAYGFAVGQLCALVWRKSAVAVVVAVLNSAGVACLWVPSLLGGGLYVVQVLGAPLLLLAGCRLVLWDWVTDRLRTRAAVARLAGAVVLAVAWLGAGFVARVAEVPSEDEPFDRAALKASVLNPDEGRAALKVREALQTMKEREDQAAKMGVRPAGFVPPPALPLGPVPVPRPEEVDGVVEHGWEAVPPQMNDWLNKVTDDPGPIAVPVRGTTVVGLLGAPRGQGPLLAAPVLMALRTWPALLAEGARMPPGVLISPLDDSAGKGLAADAHRAAALLSARALQLQARGATEEALDHLLIVLALSRHLRHQAPTYSYLEGVETERLALDGLGHWLNRLGPEPKLLRRALDGLSEHEAGLPPVTEALAAEYLRFRETLDKGRVVGGQGTDTEAILVQTPWEMGRARRLTGALFAGRRRMAESGDIVPQSDDDLFADWLSDAGRAGPGRLGRLAHSSWLAGSLPVTAPVQRAAQLSLCRARAARLQVALALYQAEHGQAAAALDDLVPGVLPDLPEDPYSRGPFHYRVSKKEQLAWPRQLPGGVREVPAGQGILWSVGPDGSDDGGTRQWGTGNAPGAGTDLIFLVPLAKAPGK
jgi:ABC-type transport system involved in multi-copper enzyme maturation permease subunit